MNSGEGKGRLDSTASLQSLPNEVILQQLLPYLPAKDVVALSRVNKQLNTLATDETLWYRLIIRDYTFPPSLLASPAENSGWSKRVYAGLSSPEVNVWGSTDNGRLGVDLAAIEGNVRRNLRHVNSPLKVTFPSLPADDLTDLKPPRIVNIEAGGYSFTARDADGGVWVWGQLDGSSPAFYARTWENRHAQATRPTRLPLPCKVESICTSRTHLLCLDSDNLIWEMRAWGLAYHHTASVLTAPANSGSSGTIKHIIQLAASWNHSACLTSKGDIFFWSPFTAAYSQSLTPEDQLTPSAFSSLDGSGRQDQRWGKVGEVVSDLPPIPLRPRRDLTEFDDPPKGSEEPYAKLKALEIEWQQWEKMTDLKRREELEIVTKIASAIDSIVALKANGEVWYHKLKSDGRHGRTWLFMPHLSGPTIIHISAQYLSITSYCRTTINHIRFDPAFEHEPQLLIPKEIRGLVGKRIIQVVSGDHHEVALTEGGEVWSWGGADHGQMGNGTTLRSIQEPQRAIFPGDEKDGPKTFAFCVAAGGYHTGVLVLGDASRSDEPASVATDPPADTTTSQSEFSQERPPRPVPNPWDDSPSFASHRSAGGSGIRPTVMGSGSGLGQTGRPIFRVGFAGRGSAIGEVASRNWQTRQQADQAEETAEDEARNHDMDEAADH